MLGREISLTSDAMAELSYLYLTIYFIAFFLLSLSAASPFPTLGSDTMQKVD